MPCQRTRREPILLRFHRSTGLPYFTKTIGVNCMHTVNQEEHHQKISFVDELRKLVEEAGLEFDARYLP